MALGITTIPCAPSKLPSLAPSAVPAVPAAPVALLSIDNFVRVQGGFWAVCAIFLCIVSGLDYLFWRKDNLTAMVTGLQTANAQRLQEGHPLHLIGPNVDQPAANSQTSDNAIPSVQSPESSPLLLPRLAKPRLLPQAAYTPPTSSGTRLTSGALGETRSIIY
ncbi:uncharacterized protein N7482_006563 [Penicillium canariense]|uniref:Uncharacterized protein n=1 Tax=Penicillium canariense TaxID=189055 RepID=A0A9W9LJA1_9EURO|nr:uncharacterized protein N7482_006563 [Penicillium canariense]KAJ5159559.1 hypothetical protein N7482_006563 [Penicillium canariense]